MKKDQEDLLVLLADQDGQVLKYKDRLKNLGQTVNLSPFYLDTYLIRLPATFEIIKAKSHLCFRSLTMKMMSWTSWQETLMRSFNEKQTDSFIFLYSRENRLRSFFFLANIFLKKKGITESAYSYPDVQSDKTFRAFVHRLCLEVHTKVFHKVDDIAIFM